MSIDLTKYEGHAPGPWMLDHVQGRDPDDLRNVNIESPLPDKDFPALNPTTNVIGGCGCCESPWVRSKADLALLLDAPALLAEVVRLRADLAEAVALLLRTSAEMTDSGWEACDGVHSDIIDALAKHNTA